ncbi:hypothetical protein O0882_15085 [Janthinobacterium sp. SUN073]|uniref:hypothetical protein n=1 Tax=Janthinobacterium sp. SUN073 TaxID=3004102 RepID=UPI0025B08F64|nr:hypothetical protein [Janthinobacterium sp. SUN073]MDN2697647.1 hypothetical protein [Janthinobacterium sp. SUN073]
MNPSEVAAAPARTGMPKILISAPPAAVVSMAMNAFQVVEMKKPAEAGLWWSGIVNNFYAEQ